MFEVVYYNSKVYPKMLKNDIFYFEWLKTLSEREKDILLISTLINSARLAMYPDELTTIKNYKDLETLTPILEKYEWSWMLDKNSYEEGYSITGEDFFKITTVVNE